MTNNNYQDFETVVACSPYCNTATPTAKLDQLCEILRQKAQEYHMPFIDYMMTPEAIVL